MKYQLKKIRTESIAAAVEKAEKYRDLNQPNEAESICRDILEINPDHAGALRTLGLTLTDQFEGMGKGRFQEAMTIFHRLSDDYERAFYSGIACERQAKSQLKSGRPLRSVLPLFEQALTLYEEAERLRPEGRDDPILRWNSVVRILRSHSEHHDPGERGFEVSDDSPPGSS